MHIEEKPSVGLDIDDIKKVTTNPDSDGTRSEMLETG